MGQELDQTEKSFWFGIYLDAINMWIQNKLMEIKQWLKMIAIHQAMAIISNVL